MNPSTGTWSFCKVDKHWAAALCAIGMVGIVQADTESENAETIFDRFARSLQELVVLANERVESQEVDQFIIFCNNGVFLRDTPDLPPSVLMTEIKANGDTGEFEIPDPAEVFVSFLGRGEEYVSLEEGFVWRLSPARKPLAIEIYFSVNNSYTLMKIDPVTCEIDGETVLP